MKTYLLLFALAITTIGYSNNSTSINLETNNSILVGKKKVELGVSESDAEIFINGKLVGKGGTEVTVPKNDCVTVIIKKVAYLTERIEFCNKKDMTKPPKTHYVEMKRDDSYDASILTDIANIDIELKCNSMEKDKAWKLINQIVLTYIDVIEMTDKETGYLRTSWSLKTFMQNTVRTRIIIKESSSDPLMFKVKLISEASGMPMTSVKSDELYKEWDRVLRSYSNVISEFQARVK
ncbi:hypothetical protein [Lacinutrix sp. Bg11-31]|uniref:hypothetical protein n=1 Tax=Lacinutrix sp. Bg11-31 TaxID=2057808 RepID=UPI000C306258|nr:hypothetical protein [Lacinutrix sp. Bg11-31]AUC82198.1 hypothetical protein CW733_08675 [Lacinutrix sp. Bg11-31]